MKIYITETATNSVEEIEFYLVKRFSERTKNKFSENIKTVFTTISRNPYIGVSYKKKYRKFNYKKSIIFYRIDEEKHEIYITHVIDSRRNYNYILFTI